MDRRVAITGIGLVTPLAIGREETWTAVIHGRSGIGPTTLFDVTDFATKYGKTVVKSDRDAFKKVATPFLTGAEVPWDKALDDKVQAIK